MVCETFLSRVMARPEVLATLRAIAAGGRTIPQHFRHFIEATQPGDDVRAPLTRSLVQVQI